MKALLWNGGPSLRHAWLEPVSPDVIQIVVESFSPCLYMYWSFLKKRYETYDLDSEPYYIVKDDLTPFGRLAEWRPPEQCLGPWMQRSIERTHWRNPTGRNAEWLYQNYFHEEDWESMSPLCLREDRAALLLEDMKWDSLDLHRRNLQVIASDLSGRPAVRIMPKRDGGSLHVFIRRPGFPYSSGFELLMKPSFSAIQKEVRLDWDLWWHRQRNSS